MEDQTLMYGNSLLFNTLNFMESTARAELLSYLFWNHTVFTSGSHLLSQRPISFLKMDPPTILGRREMSAEQTLPSSVAQVSNESLGAREEIHIFTFFPNRSAEGFSNVFRISEPCFL